MLRARLVVRARTCLGAPRPPPSNGNTLPTKKALTHVANIKQQLKRIKTNEKRTERNKAVKSEFRTWVRKFREAAAAGDKDTALAAGRDAARKLDKAVSKGVIHQNQAANKKSSMARKAATL